MVDETRRRLLAMGVGVAAASDAIAAGGLIHKPDGAVCGCAVVQSSRSDGVHTGGSRTVRIDGRFDVWVKQVGTGEIPVLTLHGGPGFNHFYLECLEDFLPQAGVRFWYYDQLGCGFSDSPDDVSALGHLESFVRHQSAGAIDRGPA
jgi:pimeloyl-ACP methyl ester carboxylesterase